MTQARLDLPVTPMTDDALDIAIEAIVQSVERCGGHAVAVRRGGLDLAWVVAPRPLSLDPLEPTTGQEP